MKRSVAGPDRHRDARDGRTRNHAPLAASAGLCRVPIIAISASPTGGDESRSLRAGADAFVAKPIHLDTLLARIAALLALTWIMRLLASTRGRPRLRCSVSAVPSHEMQDLHRLARQGNMREIVLWAERIDNPRRALRRVRCRTALTCEELSDQRRSCSSWSGILKGDTRHERILLSTLHRDRTRPQS